MPRLRLADTDLVIEVERDLTTYGEEVKFGGGKVIRDGMGQSQHPASEVVDVVITNALILDWWGIVKADIGLRDGADDGEYLDHLATGLEEVGRQADPDLVFYLAGADPYMDDRLGGLALSMDGLHERDPDCAYGVAAGETLGFQPVAHDTYISIVEARKAKIGG